MCSTGCAVLLSCRVCELLYYVMGNTVWISILDLPVVSCRDLIATEAGCERRTRYVMSAVVIYTVYIGFVILSYGGESSEWS